AVSVKRSGATHVVNPQLYDSRNFRIAVEIVDAQRAAKIRGHRYVQELQLSGVDVLLADDRNRCSVRLRLTAQILDTKSERDLPDSGAADVQELAAVADCLQRISERAVRTIRLECRDRSAVRVRRAPQRLFTLIAK